MDLKNLGKSVKTRRTYKSWSQSELAYQSAVSLHIISKIEKGEPVKEVNLAKVMDTLGMKSHMETYKINEKASKNYKDLSLDELRLCIQFCKDFIRDGEKEIKIEVADYKKHAEKEVLERLRSIFKGGVEVR